MSVSDGQRVNAQTFNTGLASKTQDNTFTGKQTLNRADSGAPVEDVQQEINALKSATSENASEIESAEGRIETLEELSQAAGSGGGLLPMITGDDSNFEIALGSNWNRYIDAAQEAPEDGDGGVSEGGEGESGGEGEPADGLSFARTSDASEVLAGLGSAKISKPALDLQGEGVSITRAVPPGARGRNAVLRFIYSATENFHFADTFDTEDVSDITVNVLDVTNNLLFTSVETLPKNLDDSGTYEGSFKLAPNCESIRIILHVATTNEDAWDFIFDSVDLNLKSPVTHDFIQLQEWSGNPATPPTGRKNIFAKNDGKVYQQDSLNVIKELGSGSGGGGFMPLLSGDNSNCEASIGDWETYKDTAGTQPEDGDGGTAAAITFTRTTTTVLNGEGSFLLVADGDANPQGEGASLTVDVPDGLKGKPAKVRFVYAGDSNFNFGSFGTDSDVIVQMYDVTNSKLLNPYPHFLDGSGIYEGQFQIPSDCASLRLILHVTLDSDTAAFALALDEVQIDIAPNEFVKADSDWESYTPTFTGFGTPTNVSFKYRKNGPNLEIEGVFTTGTPTATEAQMTLPEGLVSSSGLPTLSHCGTATKSAGASTTVFGWYTLIEPSKSYLTFGAQFSNVNALSKANGNAIFAASQTVSIKASVPIQGWTSGNLTAASANLNAPVVFAGEQSSQSLTASTTDIALNATKDTTGCWDGTKFKVKVPGDYLLAGSFVYSTTASMQVFKNGSLLVSLTVLNTSRNSGTILLENLTYGDEISLRANVNGTLTSSYASIHRIETSGRVYKTRVAWLRHQVPAGTAGGSSVAETWNDRLLNTAFGDLSFVSLNASNGVFTLQPGTYYVSGTAMIYRTQSSVSVIRDVVDNSTPVIGLATFGGDTENDIFSTVLSGEIKISEPKDFKLQTYTQRAQATNGLGSLGNTGVDNVHAELKIEKVL